MRNIERSGAVGLWGAVCLSGLLLLTGTPLEAQAARQSCELFDVSPPKPLKDAKGRPIYVDVPYIVKSGDNVLLFGNSVVLWRSEHVFADTVGMIDEAKAGTYIDTDTLAGAVIDEHGIGTTFGKPKGVKRMRGMVAGSDGEGGAWVAWLEAADSVRKEPTDLLVAHFKSGAWISVERVYHGLFIFEPSVSMSEPGQKSAPLIAISSDVSMRGTDPHGLGIFRRGAQGWSATWIGTGYSLPFATHIARVTDERILVGYIGSRRLTLASPDTNQIWVAHSDDDGKTWSGLTSVANVWNRRGNWPDFRPSTNSRVELTWMDDKPGDSVAKVVHLRSADGGSSWSSAPSTSFRRIKFITAFSHPDGLALIVGEALDSLALVELRSGEAPTLQRLQGQGATLFARTSTLGNTMGTAIVVWSRLIANAYPMFPNIAVPASEYSWIRPCKQ